MSYVSTDSPAYYGKTGLKKLVRLIAANFSAVASRSPASVTITGTDLTNGTGRFTLQVKDSTGANLITRPTLIDLWFSTAANGAPNGTGISGTAIGTGTAVQVVTANALYRIATDAQGVAVVTITSANGTYHCMVAAGGTTNASSVTTTGAA